MRCIDPATGKVLARQSTERCRLNGCRIRLENLSLTYKSDCCTVSRKFGIFASKSLSSARQLSSKGADNRTVAFGFRTFAPEGLGTNALFRLNGRRMKIYTAISWGYWGINGMWPTPELAEKEVTQAKKLNLTCLNFHRNLAKEDVLRAHDRLGLLRYMEPGAGKMAIGRLPSGQSGAQAANSVVMEKATGRGG